MDPVQQLDRVFCPRSVAVVGASVNPDKVGCMCLTNILDGGYRGRVYPVNPSLTEAFGLRAFPSVEAIPGEIDLALIVVPAEAAVSAVAACVARGVAGAVVITSGFKEVGSGVGGDLQKAMTDIARRNGIQLIGPNTLGVVNPAIRLNATFERSLGALKPGNVAVVTQSGGMCYTIAQALHDHGVGISKALGLGNRSGLDFDGVLGYLAGDSSTGVVALYVEGMEEPRKLMDAARRVVGRKPVLVLKGGRAEQSSRATLSHTGALAGRDELYRAAFRQSGIITAEDVTGLIDKAKALAFQPPAPGNRAAIITSMGGPGVVMLDACYRHGLQLAQLSPATWQRLRKVVSPLTSVDNPVDISWDVANFETSREVLRALMEDSGVDGIAVSIGGVSLGVAFGRAALEVTGRYGKPLVISLGPEIETSAFQQTVMEGHGIPTYPAPDRAVTGLAGLVQYGEVRKVFG